VFRRGNARQQKSRPRFSTLFRLQLVRLLPRQLLRLLLRNSWTIPTISPAIATATTTTTTTTTPTTTASRTYTLAVLAADTVDDVVDDANAVKLMMRTLLLLLRPLLLELPHLLLRPFCCYLHSRLPPRYSLLLTRPSLIGTSAAGVCSGGSTVGPRHFRRFASIDAEML
jgi:hypothetical protein